jgi:hypothetical protein
MPDGSLRARPLDGPLPPSGGAWSVGDACMVEWVAGDGALHVGVVKSIGAGAAPGYEQCIVKLTDVNEDARQVLPLSQLRPLSHSYYAVAASRDLDISHRLPGEKDFLSALERLILQVL